MKARAVDANAGSAEAEAAIRTLVASYAYAVLTADTELWLSLWQEPAGSAGDPLSLDLNWARAVSERWDSLGTVLLHVTTHLIRPLGPGRAHGRVFCLAQLDRTVEGRRNFVEQTIVYEDRYACTDGAWQFATRRHLLWYGRSVPNPLEQRPANWPSSQVGCGVDLPAALEPLPGQGP
jgi:hypothetical protein